MEIGGKLDKENEIVLGATSTINNVVTIHKAGITIDIEFLGIYYSYMDNEGGDLFGSKPENYTFRDYGKLKNFALRTNYRYGQTSTHIVIPKSYLPRLQNSPIIDKITIEENLDRVYALDLHYERKTVYTLSLLKPLDFQPIGFTHDDMITFTAMLGEETVVGLFVLIPEDHYYYHFLLLVDDNTKRLLNKLIYIYTHISDFLEKHNITLKDVLEDVDLYVAVAATAATET
jgi:hypothetical protein